MKSRKVQVGFTAPDIEIAETLICDVFFDLGLKGVVCQTPLDKEDIAPTDVWDDSAVLPETENTQPCIVGYLPDIAETDGKIDEIQKRINELEPLGILTSIQISNVDDRDWAHAWKDHFHVTRITDRVVVRPSWKPFDPAPSDLVIDLDPGMAFGTGTHPTTFMCIQLIEQFLDKGQTILDVGTGSGILLVAAHLLGASRLTGIDIDPTAVDVSKENLLKNKISENCFELSCTGLSALAPKSQTFDLVVANILAHVLVALMTDLKQRAKPGGILILSGIVKERLSEVEDAAKAAGMISLDTRYTDEWVALALKAPEHS